MEEAEGPYWPLYRVSKRLFTRYKYKFGCSIPHTTSIGRGFYIGHHVYIGPGAKLVGAVRVGDYAAIGANCVVTDDVPDHAVVVGVPGRVISFEGSSGYVNRTDYEGIGQRICAGSRPRAEEILSVAGPELPTDARGTGPAVVIREGRDPDGIPRCAR